MVVVRVGGWEERLYGFVGRAVLEACARAL